MLDAARRVGWSAEELGEAGEAGSGGCFDAVLVGVGAGRLDEAVETVRAVSAADGCVSVLACVSRVRGEDVVRLMRAGACDVIGRWSCEAEVLERLSEAVGRTRGLRAAEDRSAGLSRMCRRLEDERRELSDLVGGEGVLGTVGGAVGGSCGGFGGEVEGEGLFPRGDGWLDGELDVEALLRGSLEWLAGRMRSMNAAVFLPTSGGDYALGGYVNADLSGSTRDVLLDALADAVPGVVEQADGLVVLEDAACMEGALGEAAGWLSRSVLVAGSCVARGETIAVLAFFRGRSEGFSAGEIEELRRFRAVFTTRLARVVRVHNRTVPGLQWFGFDVGEAGEDESASGEEWRDAA